MTGEGRPSGPALAASPTAQAATQERLRAQLAEAEAVLRAAQQRLEQAQAGQGGIGARPEDIAIAEADLLAARVALRLRQPSDDVRFLRGPIRLFDGPVRAVRDFRHGCDDVDAITLELNVATERARLNCRQAVLNDAVRNLQTAQTRPYAWADPDLCDLAQLWGKLPPFAEQDVRFSTPPPLDRTEGAQAEQRRLSPEKEDHHEYRRERPAGNRLRRRVQG